jgi:hypothetical protein
MDSVNRFDTPTTHNLMRAEQALLTAASGYLLVRHRKRVRWPVAIALFAWSDALGYIPGAIAYRKSADKRVSKGYYLAYNVGHSALSGAALAGLWARFVRPEWALLAIPLHLGGDRSVFGNFLKPFSVPFEPEAHPAWEQVKDQLEQPWQGWPETGEKQASGTKPHQHPNGVAAVASAARAGH